MAVPERLGDFELVAEIGRGGFGIVYRARQVSLGRPVALKVLYEHRVHTKEEVTRFEREAHASARLDHPAVVSVYSWGQDDGHFYIAQKLVGDGRTMADRLEDLKQSGEPPKGYFREVAETLARVCDGLQHAHEEGIVHRDLKPSNILLDHKQRPFLGDFGLAKVEDGLELSRTGDFAGSPYYMSPEQADSRRGEVDARSDIYGMGVTLYELLTLQPPFTGRSPHEIMRKILTEEPRPPSKVEDRVPRDLETIALKAMEKSPARRYQSAAAMAADLRAFLDGEPISATPVSTVSRIFRTAKRNRAGVGIVFLVLVLFLVSSKLAQESIDNKRQAKKAEVTQLTSEVTSAGRQEVSSEIDEAFEEAIASENTAKAIELQRFKSTASEWLDSGQKLLLDVMPEITDSKTLDKIGENLQGQFLFDTVKTVEAYLAQQAAGEAEGDPRLEALAEWLGEATDIGDTAQSLGLQISGLIRPAAPPPASRPIDLADVASTAAQPGDVTGPPMGPGGALSGTAPLRSASGPPGPALPAAPKLAPPVGGSGQVPAAGPEPPTGGAESAED